MEDDGKRARTSTVPEMDARERRKMKKDKKKKQKRTAEETPQAVASGSGKFQSKTRLPPLAGAQAVGNGEQGHSSSDAVAEERVRAAGRKRPRENEGDGQKKVKVSQLQHPFPADYCDHFETPLQAYRDVQGALAALAKRLGKKRKHLRIWDPYYCAGRTPRLLAQLGFPRVEHRNEDFYKIIGRGTQPPHDVIVTNPPYSGDHKKRCLEYCRTSGKPWFLLIPNYVATKDYYKLSVMGTAAGVGGEPFYVVPDTKYPFDHPEGTGHADSPFFGVWFVQCGSHNENVFEATKADNRGGMTVVRSLEELAQSGAVKTERRLNPRQRKALKKKLQLAGGVSAGERGTRRG